MGIKWTNFLKLPAHPTDEFIRMKSKNKHNDAAALRAHYDRLLEMGPAAKQSLDTLLKEAYAAGKEDKENV